MPGTGIIITVSILCDEACRLENECLLPGERLSGCSYPSHCEIVNGRLAQKVFLNQPSCNWLPDISDLSNIQRSYPGARRR